MGNRPSSCRMPSNHQKMSRWFRSSRAPEAPSTSSIQTSQKEFQCHPTSGWAVAIECKCGQCVFVRFSACVAGERDSLQMNSMGLHHTSRRIFLDMCPFLLVYLEIYTASLQDTCSPCDSSGGLSEGHMAITRLSAFRRYEGRYRFCSSEGPTSLKFQDTFLATGHLRWAWQVKKAQSENQFQAGNFQGLRTNEIKGQMFQLAERGKGTGSKHTVDLGFDFLFRGQFAMKCFSWWCFSLQSFQVNRLESTIDGNFRIWRIHRPSSRSQFQELAVRESFTSKIFPSWPWIMVEPWPWWPFGSHLMQFCQALGCTWLQTVPFPKSCLRWIFRTGSWLMPDWI